MSPRILDHLHAVDLLEKPIDSDCSRAILIICHEKEYLLEQVYGSVSNHEVEDDDGAIQRDDQEVEALNPFSHSLLSTRLHLINRSKRIKLVFCPRLDILRAFLSGRLATLASQTPQSTTLAVLDLVALHHETSEFSVQGLSRTFALLVESAAYNHMELLVNECKDVQNLDNPYRGPSLWDAQIPLLDGSIKISGEGSRWAGRMVSVKRVARRWFIFEKVQNAIDLDQR